MKLFEENVKLNVILQLTNEFNEYKAAVMQLKHIINKQKASLKLLEVQLNKNKLKN